MGLFHFFAMLLGGIILVIVSKGKLIVSVEQLKKYGSSVAKILSFVGWTFILFALYDRYILWVVG